MKTIALLLLAMTSVATAQPGRDETTGRYSYDRYDRYANDIHHPRHRDAGWTELATATADNHGTEFVIVGPEAGRFSRLRIVADEGRVDVRRVAVSFADGTRRVYTLNRRIGLRRDRNVDLDLQTDKEIDQIAVTTTRNGGTYSLYGL